MSKESSSADAVQCACGGTFVYMQYHWPICPMNPKNLAVTAKREGESGMGAKLLKTLQAKFTKSELAAVAAQGPVPDQQFGKRGKGGKRGGKR